MEFDLSWHIENWDPPCNDIDYSKKTSLELFLKKERISDQKINKILLSETLYWDALKELNPISNLSNNPVTVFSDESMRFRNILYVRTIENNKNNEVFEIFVQYLLMRIAVAISWDFGSQNTSYEPAYINFLSELTSKNAKYIFKTFGKTEISCFFLAHKRSKKKLEDIISCCLEHIKLNSRSKSTPIGNIYLTIKPEIIDAIIRKVFEIIYTNPDFSLSNLLYQDKVLENTQCENIKYDISGWKQQHGFYLIPGNMQKAFTSDLLSLNQVFERVITLEKKLHEIIISEEKLQFNVTSNDKNDFCYIKHEPLTETGKKSKYPIILHYNMKNGSFSNDHFGDVYLMDNNEIGKAKSVYWLNSSCYVINIKRVDNQLDLSSVETRDSNGNPIVLYKKSKT